MITDFPYLELNETKMEVNDEIIYVYKEISTKHPRETRCSCWGEVKDLVNQICFQYHRNFTEEEIIHMINGKEITIETTTYSTICSISVFNDVSEYKEYLMKGWL